MTVKPDDPKSTPEAQLESFVERFDPKDQKLFWSVRAAMRKRFPTANELAYRYNHSAVIAYSPSEQGIEGITSITLSSEGVRLYLLNGPKLPDPKGLLQGGAGMVRFLPLEAASDLASSDVKALIAAAVDHAKVPYPSKGKGSLIIKSGETKKRPRRKATK